MTGARPRRREKRDCPHGGRHRHGTVAAYNADRCGCGPCRTARAKQNSDYRKRAYLHGRTLVDATGTRRRVQALMRLGWTTRALAPHCGWRSAEAVQRLITVTKVTRATAAKVARVYDALSMVLGPSQRVAAYAERAGWPAPLCWDDGAIDDPAAAPYSCREERSSTARRLARVEDYHDLRGMGLSDADIARRWGISDEGMERWLYRNVRGEAVAA